MSVTELHTEDARQRRIRDQMREQYLAKFADPDRDRDLESVWVAHVWVGNHSDGEWMLAGFRRRRNRRKPQTMSRFFAKVRRQFQVDKKAPVKLMDLDQARRYMAQSDQSWRFLPPKFQDRKAKMEQHTPEVDRTKRKRRAEVRAYKLSKHDTHFIALGRMGWDKPMADGTPKIVWEAKPGYLYLGPLHAETKGLATKEARKQFPIYRDLLVIATSALSKSLRQQMAKGRKVSAGKTRIIWPEVPPTFDEVWAKFVRRAKTEFPAERRVALEGMWEAEGKPWLTLGWLRKTVKTSTPVKATVVYADRLYHCKKCKASGKTPATIPHATTLCVPISAKENARCAAKAKQDAKRKADRVSKRKSRRVAAKIAAEKAKARKRAAKKAARTRAKVRATTNSSPKPSSGKRRSPISALKSLVARLKPRSGRSTKKTASASARSTKRTSGGSAGRKTGSSLKASGRSSASTRAASASRKKVAPKKARR